MSTTDQAYPNYNVAPTTTIATVVRQHTGPDDDPVRRVQFMRWGLIPSWAKAGPDSRPAGKGRLLINARAETVTTSPAFRSSARSHRCLVPMDGYYEWQVSSKVGPGVRACKTPFFIYRDDGEPLFAAGLWSAWRPPNAAAPLLSCAIVTTAACGELAKIHDRMPLFMPKSDWDRWLDPAAPADEGLLARPPAVHGLRAREVSTLVNSVRNNGPALLEPVAPQSKPEPQPQPTSAPEQPTLW